MVMNYGNGTSGRQPDTIIVNPTKHDPMATTIPAGQGESLKTQIGNGANQTNDPRFQKTVHENRPMPAGATRIIRPEMMSFNGIGGLLVIETGEYYPLGQGSNVIGRRAKSGTADIKLSDDKYMSRRHVEIDVTKDQFGRYTHRVIEINSTNILKLNGQPVDRGKLLILHLDDELTLGTTRVRFVARKP